MRFIFKITKSNLQNPLCFIFIAHLSYIKWLLYCTSLNYSLSYDVWYLVMWVDVSWNWQLARLNVCAYGIFIIHFLYTFLEPKCMPLKCMLRIITKYWPYSFCVIAISVISNLHFCLELLNSHLHSIFLVFEILFQKMNF